MRLTLLVRADQTGLGYQTRDYYRHLKPDRTIIIDISNLNGNQQFYDWYENAELIKGIPDEDQIKNILRDTDILLTAETPYNLNLYRIARSMGVKTVCVENPEFYDHIIFSKYEMPDVIILPSTWIQEYIRSHAEPKGTKIYQIHHPVDRTQIPYKKRTTKKFVHIAGKPAMHERNGTRQFLYACPDGTVTTQDENYAHRLRREFRNARIITGITDQKKIFEYGDILVLPRKYGGNCLILNEALASGMPVIMPDISPNNDFLPKEWLVKAELTGSFTPRTKIDIYTTSHDSLVNKLDWFRHCNIEVESEKANRLADSISWETLKSRWEEAIYENTSNSTSRG